MKPPYLPFLEQKPGADFRWRLGVRPLDLADWIEWGSDADAALAYKAELNERHASTVFAVQDDIEPEANEVAAAIADHVGGVLRSDLHPLDAAARLVPEDLVLMVDRPVPEGSSSGSGSTGGSGSGNGSGNGSDGTGTPGTQLVFGGGSVCFPNRWDLRSKLGCTMAEVHEPVAQLNEQLEGAVDGFFERLRPERSYWRLGWGLLDTDDWFTPIDGTAAPRPIDPAPSDMYVRVERETLRRFPQTNAVLFTIRTYVTPLDVAVSVEDNRHWLADALDCMPLDVRDYKDIASTADALVAHLRGVDARHNESITT